jgi:hypothetical protein
LRCKRLLVRMLLMLMLLLLLQLLLLQRMRCCSGLLKHGLAVNSPARIDSSRCCCSWWNSVRRLFNCRHWSTASHGAVSLCPRARRSSGSDRRSSSSCSCSCGCLILGRWWRPDRGLGGVPFVDGVTAKSVRTRGCHCSVSTTINLLTPQNAHRRHPSTAFYTAICTLVLLPIKQS